ncbi:MAG TPA: RDD family protein [Candidatus Bathyarchaeia archaeon]|nr:RDD family protein [Candidatus Bathyarchaeia archaeon]
MRDDRNVQNHWARRLVAVIIDVVIVSVTIAIISFTVAVPFLVRLSSPTLVIPEFPAWWGVWFGGVIPFLLVPYFVLAEAFWGRTIGKEIMGLRVVRVDGNPVDLVSSFVRNISKLHVLILILDVALGMGMHGEVSQKFSDRYIGTKVESVSQIKLIS